MVSQDDLRRYAEMNLNVLFIGGHGVGKTTMFLDLFKELKMKVKYYSASTLDPFVDLGGIPVPDPDNNHITFKKTKAILEAEVIFMDELNRSHPKVRDAVLEMVQFKSINGEKLPKLKMVWAAINPPSGRYQVQEMDPTLVDRFHIYIDVPAKPDVKYYIKVGIKPQIAEALVNWWNSELNNKQRGDITPRRLEYMGKLMSAGLKPDQTVPPGVAVPITTLKDFVDGGLVLEYKKMKDNPEPYLEELKKDPTFTTRVVFFIRGWSPVNLLEIMPILVALPKDMVQSVASKKSRRSRLQMVYRLRAEFKPGSEGVIAKQIEMLEDVFGDGLSKSEIDNFGTEWEKKKKGVNF